jgi:hypothetical protein
MIQIKRLSILLLAMLLTAGCGSKFQPDSLQSDELEQGTRIGLLPINFLEKPSVDVHDNPVGLLGTAGRITVTKGKDTKRRKFTSALSALKYSYQQQATEGLLARFAEADLDVELMGFKRSHDNILEAVPPRRFEKRYPDGDDNEFDLLLDIYIDYVGYSAAKLGADYLPTVHIGARLVDANNHEVVYNSLIQYQSFDDAEEGVSAIDADPAYAFAGFDELMAEPEKARDGLRLAVDGIVTRLIEEITPN